jgi:hypothetical protein
MDANQSPLSARIEDLWMQHEIDGTAYDEVSATQAMDYLIAHLAPRHLIGMALTCRGDGTVEATWQPATRRGTRLTYTFLGGDLVETCLVAPPLAGAAVRPTTDPPTIAEWAVILATEEAPLTGEKNP